MSQGASLLFLDHAGFVEGLRHAPGDRFDSASACQLTIAAKVRSILYRASAVV
jgi:hypothetical protein